MLIVPLSFMHYSVPVPTFSSFHIFLLSGCTKLSRCLLQFLRYLTSFFFFGQKYYPLVARELILSDTSGIHQIFLSSAVDQCLYSPKSLNVSSYFCYPYVYSCVLFSKIFSTSTLHTFAYLSFSPISHIIASRLTVGVLCYIDIYHLPLSFV